MSSEGAPLTAEASASASASAPSSSGPSSSSKNGNGNGNGKIHVAVFGSSSHATPEPYLQAATALGEAIKAGGHVCVNGGGKHGVMGALNRCGGHIKACIHEIWVQGESAAEISEMAIARGPNLAERKHLLFRDASCIIVLPGGPGTWDEMWEIVCERQIGFSNMPIALINVDGYYDGFLEQMERAHNDRILYKDVADLMFVTSDAVEGLNWCLSELGHQREEGERKKQLWKPQTRAEARNVAIRRNLGYFSAGLLLGALVLQVGTMMLRSTCSSSSASGGNGGGGGSSSSSRYRF